MNVKVYLYACTLVNIIIIIFVGVLRPRSNPFLHESNCGLCGICLIDRTVCHDESQRWQHFACLCSELPIDSAPNKTTVFASD
jgi:hypothetical protein